MPSLVGRSVGPRPDRRLCAGPPADPTPPRRCWSGSRPPSGPPRRRAFEAAGGAAGAVQADAIRPDIGGLSRAWKHRPSAATGCRESSEGDLSLRPYGPGSGSRWSVIRSLRMTPGIRLNSTKNAHSDVVRRRNQNRLKPFSRRQLFPFDSRLAARLLMGGSSAHALAGAPIFFVESPPNARFGLVARGYFGPIDFGISDRTDSDQCSPKCHRRNRHGIGSDSIFPSVTKRGGLSQHRLQSLFKVDSERVGLTTRPRGRQGQGFANVHAAMHRTMDPARVRGVFLEPFQGFQDTLGGRLAINISTRIRFERLGERAIVQMSPTGGFDSGDDENARAALAEATKTRRDERDRRARVRLIVHHPFCKFSRS